MISQLWQDARYAARMLRLNPGFALVAVVSLALGTGANTAIFQLLDAIRLRSLPVQAPQELTEVRIEDMTEARGNWLRQAALTYPLWERIRDEQQEFSGTFAWASETLNITASGESRQIGGLWVSGDFFQVLGIKPALGRTFTAEADHRGCGDSPGAVISYGFWRQEFAGDRSIIGRRITIGEHRVEVIGVTPPGFFGLEVGRMFDIALPLCSEPAWYGDDRLPSGTTWWLTVMGRLKPGVSLQQADARFRARSPSIFQPVPADYPPASVQSYRAMKLVAIPSGSGISRLRSQYAGPLILLLAIAGLVLLIACANLANLLLARTSSRNREIALRLAMGASRMRLMNQFLTEGLLLALAGTLLGLILARMLSRFLISFLTTAGDSTFVDLHADWRVFAFTALLAVLTCLLFSLTPALRAAQTDPGEALKSGSRGTTSGRERSGFRRLLVVSQIALSLVLAVGAMLFVRTLRNLTAIDPGFQQHGLLVADLVMKQNHPTELRREILERLRAIPGVESAAEATLLPLSGANWNSRIWMDGSDSGHARVVWRTMAGSDYFKTLQTPLIAGRDFDEHEVASSARVAIVNEVFAREIAGGSDVLGKRFWVEATPYEPVTPFEIVGIVKNTKYLTLREEFQPLMFIPLRKAVLEGDRGRFVIRSAIAPDALVSSVRHAFDGINPSSRYAFHFLDSWIDDSLRRERLMAILSGIFGALAVALTAVGIYSVISFTVARRTNEIGIRMALGADRGRVVALILRESVIVLACGLSVGAILAVVAYWGVSSLLYGTQPYDPLTLASAAIAITAIVTAASLIPARRASSLDPIAALREE